MSIHDTENISGNLSVQNNMQVGGNTDVNGNMKIGHNLIVEGWVLANNVKWPNVGLFDSVESLAENYGSGASAITQPKNGWTAGVIEDSTVKLYYYKNGTWIASGLSMSEYTGGSGDMTGYATLEYVDGKLSGKADLIDLAAKANVRYVDNMAAGKADLRYVDRQLAAKANVSYVDRNLALKANAESVYSKSESIAIQALVMDETVRCKYELSNAGQYTLADSNRVKLMEVNGVAYRGTTITVEEATTIEARFIFDTPGVIPDNAFNDIMMLTEVHLPSHIHLIGDAAFKACSQLNKIECESVTPPITGTDALQGIDSEAVLFVHAPFVTTYEASTYWDGIEVAEL